jgi:putative ABC transport system permease protein
VIGRPILPTDVQPGGEAEPVIVLSFRAWQRLFNSSPEALGQTVVLDDVPRTVIGVMPPRFGWWTNDGGWVPLATSLRADATVFPILRLRPGVSRQAAEEQYRALENQLAGQFPARFPKNGFRASLINYMDITVASGEMRSSLQLLFGAVAFLLLIACANVANLQMTGATARAREIALRMSVGAGRPRVLAQLLTENIVLSLAGGILGVLLALGITRGVVYLMPEFYVPNEARISVNGPVLLFSVAVSLLTGILFGLAPALQCARLDLVEALKDSARGSNSSAAGSRTRNLLVVAAVALSVILLAGASLTIRGFQSLQHVDPGFQPGRVLMVNLQLPDKRYSTYEQRIAFNRGVLDRVRALPGVEAASIGNGGLPLPFGGPQSSYTIAGQQLSIRNLQINLVSPDYQRTLGIPLLDGREITEQETAHGDRLALINEAAARLWPAGRSPLGGRIHLDLLATVPATMLPPGVANQAEVTVVGILRNTRNAGLASPPEPAVYIPYTLVAPPGRTLAIRTARDPLLMMNALQHAVGELDRELPVGRPITLEEIVGQEIVQPRFNMALFTFFGALGLALSAAGIFSLLSYSVARRTHEIGIRMALGAERGAVLSLILASGAKPVLTGMLTGLAGAIVLARLLRSEVFQVPATDPLALGGVLVVLATAAFLACLLPARRAARLDPMAALRQD